MVMRRRDASLPVPLLARCASTTTKTRKTCPWSAAPPPLAVPTLAHYHTGVTNTGLVSRVPSLSLPHGGRQYRPGQSCGHSHYHTGVTNAGLASRVVSLTSTQGSPIQAWPVVWSLSLPHRGHQCRPRHSLWSLSLPLRGHQCRPGLSCGHSHHHTGRVPNQYCPTGESSALSLATSKELPILAFCSVVWYHSRVTNVWQSVLTGQCLTVSTYWTMLDSQYLLDNVGQSVLTGQYWTVSTYWTMLDSQYLLDNVGQSILTGQCLTVSTYWTMLGSQYLLDNVGQSVLTGQCWTVSTYWTMLDSQYLLDNVWQSVLTGQCWTVRTFTSHNAQMLQHTTEQGKTSNDQD